MKKLFFQSAAILLFLLGLTFSVSAEDYTIGDWVYHVEDGTASIARYAGSEREITVPTSVVIDEANYKIRTINSLAFENCSFLTHVTIPKGINTIGGAAFRNCTMLTRVDIQGDLSDGDARSINSNGEYYESNRSIANAIFYNTGKNADSFTVCFGEDVTRVPAYLFATSVEKDSDDYAHVTHIIIGESVTQIGDYAFYHCYDLEGITFGDELDEIGTRAFAHNTNLAEVSFNNRLSRIGSYAFENNSGLKKVNFNPRIVTIEEGAFSDCSKLQGVTIPPSIATIEDYAFQNCTRLASFTLNGAEGKQVRLGRGALRHCTGLEEAVINADIADGDARSVNGNGEYYESNRSYANAVFYDTGKNADAFHVVFTDQVTRIPAYLFATGIDKGSDEYSHIASLTIGSSVTDIGEYAFYKCYELRDIVFGEQTKTIASYAFAENTALKTLVLNSGMESVGAYAFSRNTALKTVEFDEKLVFIGEAAFEYCSALESIDVPKAMAIISDYAFQNCTRLERIRLNGTAGNETTLGRGAFRNCTALSEVVINADIADCDARSLNGNGEYYESNRGYSNAVFYNSGNNAQDMTVIFTDQVSRIPAYLFGTGLANGEDVYSHMTELVVGSQVKTIGSYAFCRCYRLNRVFLGDAIQTVGQGAFLDDNNISLCRYAGTPESWNAITLEADNDDLANAERVFNAEREESGRDEGLAPVEGSEGSGRDEVLAPVEGSEGSGKDEGLAPVEGSEEPGEGESAAPAEDEKKSEESINAILRKIAGLRGKTVK